MNRRLLVSLLALSIVSWPFLAEARLGESMAQLVQRYGKPIKASPNRYYVDGRQINATFVSGSWTINVNLFYDKAETIEYSIQTAFDDSEIQKLLQNNSQGKKWQLKGWDDRRHIKSWLRSDGGTAEYITPGGYHPEYRFYFRSGENDKMNEEEDKRKRAAERERQKQEHEQGSENF